MTLSGLLVEAVVTVVTVVVPLEVYPSRGNGFAAAFLGALVGLGILIVVMMFISSKPKNRRRRQP